MMHIDSQTMFEVAPRFSGENAERQHAIITACGEVLQVTLQEYDISNRLRIAHFLGQTCHESAGFRTTEEFASGDGYEGRSDLGNNRPGDGRRYKGRGLLQLTGRANYRTLGGVLGIDLEGNPELAGQPALSLRIACEYWKSHDINRMCDQDDLMAVTRAINGGLNGLEDRRLYTNNARRALARIEGMQLAGAQNGAGSDKRVLHRGSKGEDVAELQTLLRNLDFAIGIDGDFGAGTEVAVTRFQSEHRLDADGIVGAQTWAALKEAKAPAHA
jgi:putative chitinase